MANQFGLRAAALSVVLNSAIAGPAAAADQALIDAARREGSVTWYTTQIVNQLVVPAQQLFEKKYGVKVNYVRSNNGELILRVINEAKAGKPECDVFDGLSTVAALRRDNMVMKWTPDEAKSYPPERVDPDGYWIATYLAVQVPGINTNMVRPADEPNSWDDLLDPKWRGKMIWNSAGGSASASGVVGMILDSYGEARGMEYLRKLAQQQIVNVPASSRQILDQVVAGEYAMALQISNHHAWFSAQQGAPAKWLPISPTMVNSGNVSVALHAPRPNAAKLLVDFLVSPEGQAVYRDNGYIPANPKTPPTDPSLVPDGMRLKGVFYTPERLDAELPKWDRIYRDLFK